MKIQVNAHSSVDGTDLLTEMIEATIHAGLDRYGDRLTRVEAHLSEQDRTKGKDQGDDSCMLEARPTGMKPVAVTGTGGSRLDRTFGRIDSRDADATIRQNRP